MDVGMQLMLSIIGGVIVTVIVMEITIQTETNTQKNRDYNNLDKFIPDYTIPVDVRYQDFVNRLEKKL